MRSNISNIILIGSGKGGVNKSTTATLLSLELKKRGYKVALADEDISGPSLPKITGTHKPLSGGPKEGIVPPLTVDGIPLLSIELLMNLKSTAILWKGDRIQNFIKNTLENVNFGEVDYLVIDLPPGFGDAVQAPIEFAKEHKIKSGMVFVSTPQEVSMNDIVKSITAARKLNIPIIGIIESMSSFKCPNCKTEHKIFGEGVVSRISKEQDIKYLGNVPLIPDISKACDTSLNLSTIPNEAKPYISAITNNILKFYGE